MTFAAKLQYAGGDPYERESERLPYPVFEALTNGADDADRYEELAEVRWLADELESDVAGDTTVPEETRTQLFRAVADTQAPLSVAVDHYVAAWLARRREFLIEEWGIDRPVVDEACEEYDVLGAFAFEAGGSA